MTDLDEHEELSTSKSLTRKKWLGTWLYTLYEDDEAILLNSSE